MNYTFYSTLFISFLLPSILYASSYTIDEENTYAVLINDLSKSYIEQLSKHSDEIDSSLIVSKVKGNMHMLNIKKEIIPCLRKNNISFFSFQNVDLNIIELCASPFTSQFKKELDKFTSENTSHYFQSAMIDFLIFNPSFIEPFTPQTLADKIILRQAFSIAITRFDNQEWHEKINICLQKNPQENMEKEAKILITCMNPYFEIISAEMIPIVEELKPYRSFFQRAVPFPNKSDMEQEFSESG